MKLPIISSLFNKQSKNQTSDFAQKIKLLAKHSSLVVFDDIYIYHHNEKFHVPLIAFDEFRGIYLFEVKKWTFSELKNATIEKKEKTDEAEDTLAYNKIHEIIRRKFNELIHHDGDVDIFNYLLMENLSTDEYEDLDDSLHELLPKDRIIFKDSTESDIFKKLHDAKEALPEPLSIDKIFGTLFIQYAILENEQKVKFCTQEQIDFIKTELSNFENLAGVAKSGKSNLLLLKTIKEILDKKVKKVLIIKPTVLSKDLLQKKLIELIERAIIEIDLTAITILTPQELLNRHLAKLKKERLFDNTLYIDPKLMQKSFSVADLLICDDANMLPDNFISYLKHIQKNAKLLLVNSKTDDATLFLNQSYINTHRVVDFYKTNPHAKAMHLISTLSTNSQTNNVLIVSNNFTREKLREDLESFIEDKTILLDSSANLINQDLNNILLTTYEDIDELQTKHLILLDACSTDSELLEYAINTASEHIYIIYEQECQEIENLKEKYESSQERTRVEGTTDS
ncbi:hypothetical protein [Sulfurimonas sp.]